MTPESFQLWLVEMKAKGLATSDAHCGRLLGVRPITIMVWKREGTDIRTALACRALLKKMPAYSH